MRRIPIAFALGALVLATTSRAQQAPSSATPSPEFFQQLREIEARYNAMPDAAGTGAYPALKEADLGLPNHVVYRPADLGKLGRGKLPIVAWGNGGCAADGAGSRLHLAELASHGYLVIANGTIRSGPGQPPPPPSPMPEPGKPFAPPPPETDAAQLVQAIDWAVAENARPGSRYFGKLDTHAIAVSGWSCGGLQALAIAASDPRVKTAIIHNSGILPEARPGMDVRKDLLARLRIPILYVLGGRTDIAYINGMDDYARISGIPAAVANLDVGHGGTFYQPNGGKAAQVALAWLDWRLKGAEAGQAWFAGTDCGLCRSTEWKLDRKGF